MTLPSTPTTPVRVFISYSHKDEELREELDAHLSNLKRQGKIAAWHDRAIEAGEEWDAAIKAELEAAQVILLLISPRFMASNYCYDKEMQRAMERHDAGTARVIPIILKPVDWAETPFRKLKVLPKDGKPVVSWGDRDEAFLDVVQGIRQAVTSLATATAKPQPPQGPGTEKTSPSAHGESSSHGATPASQPPTSPAKVTGFQRKRLEQQQTTLEAEWKTRTEKLVQLKSALAIETGAAIKFQLEKQIAAEQSQIDGLEAELLKIEQALA